MAVTRNMSRLKTFEAVGGALNDIQAKIDELKRQAEEISELRVRRAGEVVLEVFPELTDGSFDGSIVEYLTAVRDDAEAYRAMDKRPAPSEPVQPAITSSSLQDGLLD